MGGENINKKYYAIGEEAARGTGEVTTVGFLPVGDGVGHVMPEYVDEPKKEFRGEQSALGDRIDYRYNQSWNATLPLPLFTEAGTTAGMVGTILHHFFGKVNSAQNASTGQYGHFFYPVSNPFAAANLDNDALTLSQNINHGATMKNEPYLGARVKSIEFDIQPDAQIMLNVEMFGQTKDTVTAELGSAVFPAENLRLDFHDFTLYTGTITKTGTPPDYTTFTFGSATAVTPDSCKLKITNPFEDVTVLGGVQYATKTRLNGIWQVDLEFTMDWEDPAAGLSGVDEYNQFFTGITYNNFYLQMDTGVQVGTGKNSAIGIDLPRMKLNSSPPEFGREADPLVTLSYTGRYDATTALYMVGLLLDNSAAAV